MFSFFAAPAGAQKLDLSGAWQAPFSVLVRTKNGGVAEGTKVEDVVIQQSKNAFEATKINGDEWVPAGKMNFRGVLGKSPFQALRLCAAYGFRNPTWVKVTVTILDSNHFRVEGPCASKPQIWTRRLPKIS